MYSCALLESSLILSQLCFSFDIEAYSFNEKNPLNLNQEVLNKLLKTDLPVQALYAHVFEEAEARGLQIPELQCRYDSKLEGNFCWRHSLCSSSRIARGKKRGKSLRLAAFSSLVTRSLGFVITIRNII